MTILQSIIFFVFGTVFGSFYNVVGDRLPVGKSIIYPRSHCTKCNHQLSPIELIPILSYIFQGGKCKKCKTKLSIFYPLYEVTSGLLFMLCYLKFGITSDIIIPITFVSMILIIIISDIQYMIIPDQVLVTFGIIIVIEIFALNGLQTLSYRLVNGVIASCIMMLIKMFGDFIFKKESMGGGDIKLLFFFGLCLGWPNAIFSIFLGSLIGFPISLIIMRVKKSNIIPFGPFLSLGAMIILFTQFNVKTLFDVLVS